VAVTVCVLAGGVGAARLLAGMVRVVPPVDITAVVNVADDDRIHGLAVSPDIDTVLYTVSGRIDPDRGWGLAGETWRAMEALRAIATTVGRDDLGWFNLGDADLGTHLYRTTRLGEGATLTEVTAELTRAFGVGCRVLPVSDDPLGTRLTTTRGDRLAFQEYFVRERHSVAVAEVTVAGAETARPAPGVLEAIGTAERVVIAPSNPIVSIGPLLAVPGVRDAVAARRADTVAVSPIVGGAALKGPADRLMAELGHEVSVVGVARLYQDLAAILVVDDVDAGLAPAVEAEGIRCVVAPTIMSDPDRAAALAQVVLGL
jgi:LPPG:FO 2-phospho-L-lactate transferase